MNTDKRIKSPYQCSSVFICGSKSIPRGCARSHGAASPLIMKKHAPQAFAFLRSRVPGRIRPDSDSHQRRIQPDAVGARQSHVGSLCAPHVCHGLAYRGANLRSQARRIARLLGSDRARVDGTAEPGHCLPHLQGRQENRPGRRVRHRPQPLPGRPRQAQDGRRAGYGNFGSPGGYRRIQRLRMPVLQGRSQAAARQPAHGLPHAGETVLQGVSARCGSSLGQAGCHGGALRPTARSGRVLGLPRLDLRAPGPDHARQPARSGDGLGEGTKPDRRHETG